MGHNVKVLALTSGDVGHQDTGGGILAKRRKNEEKKASEILGIEYKILDYHELDTQTIGANTVAYFWAMLTVGFLLDLLLPKFINSHNVLIMATVSSIICLILALTGTTITIALIAFPLIGLFVSVM